MQPLPGLAQTQPRWQCIMSAVLAVAKVSFFLDGYASIPLLRGISPMRKRPPPYDPPKTLGTGLR